MSYIWFVFGVFVMNLPFGYWRAFEKHRHNFKGIMFAIHIPVVFIIIGRISLGFSFSLVNIAMSVTAFFFGQLIGGIVYKQIIKMRLNKEEDSEGGSERSI